MNDWDVNEYWYFFSDPTHGKARKIVDRLDLDWLDDIESLYYSPEVSFFTKEMIQDLSGWTEDEVRMLFYDILIDCMPSLGMITINALTAADSVIIPVQAQFLPAKGMTQLMKSIDMVRNHTNDKLQIGGIVMTLVSLGGVYVPSSPDSNLPAALVNALNNHPEGNTIALHLDNDFVGISASLLILEKLGDYYVIKDEYPLKGKDYNDYLQYLQRQKHSRQIER